MTKAKRKPAPRDRLAEVTDWLAEGHTLVTARQRACAEWRLRPREAFELVDTASEALRERYDRVDRHQLMARVLATLEHTAHLALENGQLNTTVQAMALVAKLAALEPQLPRR